MCLKAIVGAICGMFSAGVLFMLLVLTFHVPYVRGAWISLAFAIVLIPGVAVSTHARCILLLSVPSLLSGRGRVALLSIIFAIILTGPVLNISENAEEVSTSMACMAELAVNQTRALKSHLEEPIRQIAEQIKSTILELKKIRDDIERALQPVFVPLNALHDAFDDAVNALNRITDVS